MRKQADALQKEINPTREKIAKLEADIAPREAELEKLQSVMKSAMRELGTQPSTATAATNGGTDEPAAELTDAEVLAAFPATQPIKQKELATKLDVPNAKAVKPYLDSLERAGAIEKLTNVRGPYAPYRRVSS